MKLLAIDTASEACSVSLWSDGKVCARFEVAGRTHSERLRPMVDQVLAEAGLRPAQLDGFACGIGPGSFAGVRIGVSFVQGMAAALDRPVVPLISLELLALRAFREGATVALTAIDARMDEVYYAAYAIDADGRPKTLVEPRVCAPQAVPSATHGKACGVGSGWKVYSDALVTAIGAMPAQLLADALPDVADGIALAVDRMLRGEGQPAVQVQPLYLRNRVALTLEEQRAAKNGG
jgi:tRNA threonylcarbamoyladenosine biosynthesis protein TsaB